MKFLVVVLLFALIAAGNANVFDGFFKDPEHPGKCVRDGIVLAPGEQKQPEGKCERFICLKDDGFGRIYSCDIQLKKPGCTFGDQFEPNGVFPNCCTRRDVCP